MASLISPSLLALSPFIIENLQGYESLRQKKFLNPNQWLLDCGPPASPLPEYLIEMQIVWSYPGPTESETQSKAQQSAFSQALVILSQAKFLTPVALQLPAFHTLFENLQFFSSLPNIHALTFAAGFLLIIWIKLLL